MIFSFPLPPCLSAVTEVRRLTITLACFSPVVPNRQNYRAAQLWFKPPTDLTKDRQDADWQAVQRGTVQHEILEGKTALDYQDGGVLSIKVNCREDAGKIEQPIPFGLAVTLEVGVEVDLPIYEEVRTRIQVPVPVVPEG